MTGLKRFGYLLLALVLFQSIFISFAPKKTEALSGSSFQAGRIIDDALFFNKAAMTTTQIQNFLVAKVPTCDRMGTQPSGHAGYATRADWGRAHSAPPPYTCLKSYTANTPARDGESGLCNAISAKTGRTAAQIINDVSQACWVSQKVLLVLLQKEQSLVTDDWPWPIQYRSATGYGCPDTAPCDSEYYGFFNQVYNAARQFKRYAVSPSSFNFRPYRTSAVRYHPNTSCGSKNVYMVNQATAGLYNYTPYTPNQASLDNLYGTGNSCSSYGNRNFWRIYNDWFGSTYAICNAGAAVMGQKVFRLFSIKKARHYYTAFECEANRLDATTSYNLEGVAFNQPPSGEPNTSGVFRLKKKSKWFWTMDPAERDNLKRHGYRLEGTAFVGLTAHSTNPEKLTIYRLYNPTTGGHLWTPSERERDRVDAQKAWRYEGIAYYMMPLE